MDRISMAGFKVFAGGKVRSTLNVPESCFKQGDEIKAKFLETFEKLGGYCKDQPWPKGKRIDFCIDIDPKTKEGRALAEQFALYIEPYAVKGDDVEEDLDYGFSVGGGASVMFGSRFVVP